MLSTSSGKLESLSFLAKIEKAKRASMPLAWQPDPNNAPQCLAYAMADVVDELGYGGQAGGGKTDLALGLAATKFDNSLILRREFPQLEGIILRGDEILPTSFIGGIKRRWEFDRRIITLGSLQHDKDWKKYQGRARQFLAIDEASEFPERPVRMVTGWVRAKEGQKTLVLYTFNPPTTPEGEWIIEYFKPWLDPQHPNPAKPGEVRYFAYIDDKCVEVPDHEPFEAEGEMVYPISRTFIPASRHDNQFLGEEYERRIDALPEPLRSMLKTGDMTIRAKDDRWQVIPTAWVLEAQARWQSMEKPQLAMRSLGVDVARGGEDNTVIAPLFGNWFAELALYEGAESINGGVVRDQVLGVYEVGAHICVDVIGYGASAYDHLVAVAGLEVTAINNSAKGEGTDSSGKLEFYNLRAESYWRLREALDPNSGEEIALPPGRELRVELCAARYSIRNSKILIEDKEAIKKRLGHSPDRADAVVMAWHGRNKSKALSVKQMKVKGLWWSKQ